MEREEGRGRGQRQRVFFYKFSRRQTIQFFFVLYRLTLLPQVLGRNLESLINRAQDIKKEYTDDFVSIEHMLIAMVEDPRFGKDVMREFRLDKATLDKAVKEVRGSNKVVDQDPEGKYEALSKYARDLTEAARNGEDLGRVGSGEKSLFLAV